MPEETATLDRNWIGLPPPDQLQNGELSWLKKQATRFAPPSTPWRRPDFNKARQRSKRTKRFQSAPCFLSRPNRPPSILSMDSGNATRRQDLA